MLEVQTLHIGYKKALIDQIDLEAKAGEIVAVIGRNGTGKSTFLKTMGGLIPAVSGKITWNTHDILRINAKQRAQFISIVQTSAPEWTGLTVQEVIALGAYPEKIDPAHVKVVSLLSTFRLEKVSKQRVDEISDGEQQKTMIARALMQDTPIILMDEPTAFLDYPSPKEWWELVSDLRSKNKLIIVATHDIAMLREKGADRIWLFEEGKVSERKDTPDW